MSDINDPRVFFAAERTLLAWNRTSTSLMAFGFIIERFGLFLEMIGKEEFKFLQRDISLFIGAAFIILATAASFLSVLQFRKVLASLRPVEIPEGYNVHLGVITNGLVAVLGAALTLYIFLGFY